MNGEGWSRLGSSHEARFEAPDLFVLRIQGDVLLSDTTALFDRIEALAAQVGRQLLLLVDVSKLGQVRPDARTSALGRDLTTSLRGLAVYGGSYHQRLYANLLIKAIPLLRPNRPQKPMLFCATEADARAFVAELRGREASAS
ncbi:STAS/SEC14 domain-containing protein [Polyangium sp. y55x31]|uniref:STAS/SEC14 domain-containing protein n=1 Tax=Polyangium sp. y55x31 TaxID=3042688 RepID=UPI0024824C87|nr:STAS/SEC14 domain-containing protein [Polyangium sp. y55x31]MDI1477978.1 STAS/SEC14 domain-containing protein [Polyangium sp. y55x31]